MSYHMIKFIITYVSFFITFCCFGHRDMFQPSLEYSLHWKVHTNWPTFAEKERKWRKFAHCPITLLVNFAKAMINRFHFVGPSLYQCIDVTDWRWSGLEMLQACNVELVASGSTLSVTHNKGPELSPSDDLSERWFHWLTGWHQHQQKLLAFVKATKWVVWWFKTVAVQKIAKASAICTSLQRLLVSVSCTVLGAGVVMGAPLEIRGPLQVQLPFLGVRHFGTWFKANNLYTRSPAQL